MKYQYNTEEALTVPEDAAPTCRRRIMYACICNKFTKKL